MFSQISNPANFSKNEVGLVPKPISQLFTKTMNTMTTIQDTVVLFIFSAGRGEAIYRSFSFHGITFGIFEKCMYPMMCHIYVLKITSFLFSR